MLSHSLFGLTARGLKSLSCMAVDKHRDRLLRGVAAALRLMDDRGRHLSRA